jgi:hypothetical protein
MQAMAQATAVPSKEVAKAEAKAPEKSFLGRIGNWLWSKAESLYSMITGVFQPAKEAEESADQNDGTTATPGLDKIPKLQSPEVESQKKLSLLLADINRKLLNSLKDIAEFEEEMRKSNSSKMDKLIFVQLFHSSMDQKKLRENAAIDIQEDLFKRHKDNKGLQKAYFDLLADIQSRAKTDKILHWINVGATAGIVGATAIAGFTGGLGAGALAIALPLSYIGKGIVTATQGILSYKADMKTGEMTVVRDDMQANSSLIEERIGDLEISDQSMADLLEVIRKVIENQGKAERASFARQ